MANSQSFTSAQPLKNSLLYKKQASQCLPQPAINSSKSELNLDLQMQYAIHTPVNRGSLQTVQVNHPKSTKNGSGMALFSKLNSTTYNVSAQSSDNGSVPRM